MRRKNHTRTFNTGRFAATTYLVSALMLAALGCDRHGEQQTTPGANPAQTTETDSQRITNKPDASVAPRTSSPTADVPLLTELPNSQPVFIDWLASCQIDDDCAGVLSCVEGYCVDSQLIDRRCDRSHRTCLAELGLECDRYGVPTVAFRCDPGFVCETDPLKEPCAKIWCQPGQTYCESERRRANCNDEGTGYSSFPCIDGTTCESGDCIETIHAESYRWCDESEAILWLANNSGTRVHIEHCSINARSRLDDSPTCDNAQCMNAGCAAGANRCVGDSRQQSCSPDGAWNPSVACEADESCIAGRCRPATCNDDDAVEPYEPHCAAGHIASCENEQWVTEPCVYGCADDGTATCRIAECEPGAAACTDNSMLAVCDSRGRLTNVPCPNGARCINAECVVNVCDPGENAATEHESVAHEPNEDMAPEKRCNGSVVEYCRPDGSGFDIEVVCSSEETCVDAACVKREQAVGSSFPVRVGCRIADTDRLSSRTALRANFPLNCIAESIPIDARVEWFVLELDSQGELNDTPNIEMTSIDETTVRLHASSTGRYRLIAEVERSDDSTTRGFADFEFHPIAPLLVQLSYDSQLPAESRELDDTNLNLYLRRPGGTWVSIENSVSNLNLSSTLGDAGAVTLERYSDRPSALEYAVFSNEERFGDVEIGVQYWSGIFPVQPRITVYRGQEIVSEITGPILSPDLRHADPQCVGPVWLAGTMNARTGVMRATNTVEPTFRELGLEQCFESGEE